MKKHLDSFERWVRRVVEGSFHRILGHEISAQELAWELHRDLVAGKKQGRVIGAFDVHLHPHTYNKLQKEVEDLPAFLLNQVNRSLRKQHIRLAVPLQIHALTKEEVPMGESLIVEHEITQGNMDVTQKFHVSLPDQEVRQDIKALDAFLIIGGTKHRSLDWPTISLGRHADNDIVLDSKRVSRYHAQIRWRYQHFVLYDLSSRAGTFVNNNRIRETILSSGDVIKVADMTLIYGEGEEPMKRPEKPQDAEDNTQLLPRVSNHLTE